MIAALATLVFFAVTPVFANRAAGLLGSLRANFWRLVVAAAFLGAWAHTSGRGLTGAALPWFVLSGIVGFGIGGVAMFLALPRIGSALSTLIVQCVSAVAAAIGEWLWLGTVLTPGQIGFALVTIAGVAIGLLPRSITPPERTAWWPGLVWATVSALGQGVGAVVSRKAFATAAAATEFVDAGSAAYQRVLGGIVVAALVVALARNLEPRCVGTARRAWPWVAANAATGPILGVTCYQWALRTTPAGIVQPIVAAAPLLTIPLAMAIEGTRPRSSYYLGAVLAVLGVSGLLISR